MNVFFATLARLIDIKNGSLRQKKKLPEELLAMRESSDAAGQRRKGRGRRPYRWHGCVCWKGRSRRLRGWRCGLHGQSGGFAVFDLHSGRGSRGIDTGGEEQTLRHLTRCAVDREAMVALEGLDRLDRAAVITAGHGALVVTQLAKTHLEHIDVLAGSSAIERSILRRPVLAGIDWRGRGIGQGATISFR